MPDVNKKEVAGEQPQQNAQSGSLKPHVDVSDKEPPKVIKEKKASLYALPGLEKYPLDNYIQVKRAQAYFGEWGTRLTPEHRREYCANLCKRASALGITVESEIRKYGAAGYAPAEELKIALDGRKTVLIDEGHIQMLDKLAELQPLMAADDFCVALGEFDKTASIDWMYDQDVLDPYYSTYGEKEAEAGDSVTIGNYTATNEQLSRFAKTRFNHMKTTFGEDMAVEFRKDPRGIFDSLPMDQRKMVLRMATDSESPHDA
jgi:hypothetical protein